MLIIGKKIIKINYKKSFLKRLKGYMFKTDPITEGICFDRCNAIHTFFMKQNIDIIMTNKKKEILLLKANVPKNRIIIKRGSYFVYELPLNSCQSFKIGETLIDKRL